MDNKICGGMAYWQLYCTVDYGVWECSSCQSCVCNRSMFSSPQEERQPSVPAETKTFKWVTIYSMCISHYVQHVHIIICTYVGSLHIVLCTYSLYVACWTSGSLVWWLGVRGAHKSESCRETLQLRVLQMTLVCPSLDNVRFDLSHS